MGLKIEMYKPKETQPNNISLYAVNYETIGDEIKDIVSKTSLDEIRKLCEDKQDVLAWLKSKIR